MRSANAATAGVSSSLKEALQSALPAGFKCKIRYVHTPPKPCDPLFSALPGHKPENTRLASHFLTLSVNATSLSHSTLDSNSHEVICLAVEVLVFTSKRLTTIFVSKVDSTSYVPRTRPSPIRITITTFLRWLAGQECQKHPARKTVLSLFARAQAQYLFPGSADDKSKHVLDDRQLIKWWATVLDPIIPRADAHVDNGAAFQGYLTVPGYAANELRSFMPPSPGSDSSSTPPRWRAGNPLLELGIARGLPEHAPPRCLLPRFPDDPKARFMQDLDEEVGISQDSTVTVSPSKRKSGRWNSVVDLDRFWEAMEFRQECSSGRAVGFLWLVISPVTREEPTLEAETSQESEEGRRSLVSTMAKPKTTPADRKSKSRRKPLTGPIFPRQPRLKGVSSDTSSLSQPMQTESTNSEGGVFITKEGYDKVMQTLLNLDFSTLEVAARSTNKWIAEVTSSCGFRSDFGIDITGSALVEVQTAGVQQSTGGSPMVNDLGGMVRKKRKATDTTGGQGPADSVQESPTDSANPQVNVLSAGTVRKKPKPKDTT